MQTENPVVSAIVTGLCKLPWTPAMLPHILEAFADIPLSTTLSLSVRDQLDEWLDGACLSGDGIALAKQLLHFCEQRGSEWVAPFRKALSKVSEMELPNVVCILDLALQRKHVLARYFLKAFEDDNRCSSGAPPKLYRTDVVTLTLVARVEPLRKEAFDCLISTILRRIESNDALVRKLQEVLSSHVMEMHVPLIFDLAVHALAAAKSELRDRTMTLASELLFQLFTAHGSVGGDLLRLCFAAVAEEGCSERNRSFFTDVLRRFMQVPDTVGAHIESAKEWLMLLIRCPCDVQPIFSLFLPLAVRYVSFYDFLVSLFRKCLLSRTTSDRRTGIWGVTQLLSLYLRSYVSTMKPAEEQHTHLINLLKPAFAFPYALRMELYTSLTQLLATAATSLHPEAANMLQELALGRLLRFLTQHRHAPPQLSVLSCCEDMGSSIRLREPIAALVRLCRSLACEHLNPLLLDLLAQLCDSPASLLPSLTPIATPLSSLTPLFASRVAVSYSLPKSDRAPECAPYKIPMQLLVDLLAPLYLMFLDWQVTSPLPLCNVCTPDQVMGRLLSVLASIKSSVPASSKSLALPTERETCYLSPAVAQWLVIRADAVLDAASAPVLFAAMERGLADASVSVRVAVAVQLLELHEKLYMLGDEEKEKRQLRVPLIQFINSLVSPLLQHHPAELLKEARKSEVVSKAWREANEQYCKPSTEALNDDKDGFSKSEKKKKKQRTVEAPGFDAMTVALTDALRDDMWIGLPLASLVSCMTLAANAARAYSDRSSARLTAAATNVYELLCTYCIKHVAPFRLMLRFVLLYHASPVDLVASLVAHFTASSVNEKSDSDDPDPRVPIMLPTTEAVALAAVLDHIAERAKEGTLAELSSASASLCVLLSAPTELTTSRTFVSRLCAALTCIFNAGTAMGKRVSANDAETYVAACGNIVNSLSAWLDSETTNLTPSLLRRMPRLIYAMERMTASANDVAIRRHLPKIGATSVSIHAPAVEANVETLSSGSGRKRAKGRGRLRSRNPYIDHFLAEQEDGKDTYADLEDFIANDDEPL